MDFRGLLNRPGLLRWHADTTEDNVHDVAVHGITHDLREDRTAEADERADGSQCRRIEEEALGHQGPPGVGVQDRDATRHVAAAHGSHEVHAHRAGQRGCGDQLRHAARGEEGGAEAELSGEHAGVDKVFPWQIHGGRGHVPVQLREGDEASREGDASDVIAQDRCAEVHAARVRVQHVRRNGGDHCGQANQRVECGDGLRQRHWAHLLANNSAARATDGHQSARGRQSCRRHGGQGGCEAARDARHAHVGTAESRLHVRQGTDGTDAEQRGDDTCGRNERAVHEGRGDQHRPRRKKQVRVLGHIGLLEKVQHALADNKAADDVHGGDDDSGTGEEVNPNVVGAKEHQAADGRGPRNGVGDGHQRRVQGMGNAPDNLVARGAGQRECAQVRQHGRTAGASHPHAEDTSAGARDRQRLRH
mmetsp:Transcript_119105/g.344504  ORF Transcript_119105/g.344504 Transcript_119105/m.344504 type:complete len:419 (+) Transcript_119105:243-1499(+)